MSHPGTKLRSGAIVRSSDNSSFVLVFFLFLFFSDIGENLWTCEQSEAVLEALNSVLFVKHKFCGNRSDYYNPTNSYIDKVIESFLID